MNSVDHQTDSASGAARIETFADPEILRAMREALKFLDSHDTADLLPRVGRTVEEIPPLTPVGKTALAGSFGGNQTSPCDDLLTGRGLFYVTERRRLCLDCTSGHYQMLWGYNHPPLCEAINRAVEAGIVWDNHANIPQTPVKLLAHRLLQAANRPGETDPIDKVLLGCCTGSTACAAALKMQLVHFERQRSYKKEPVVVVLNGNYHGTDVTTQYMRGMWNRYLRNLKVVGVEPNRPEELEDAFRRYGGRVMAFWAEPVMMNREAIPLDASYLQLARRLCDDAEAAMCIDEIQTGFWQPEIFAYRSLGFTPDVVIAGKGMTAGFHPLAAVLFRKRYDVLEQYDAINTNGSAALASFVGLWVTETTTARADRIVETGDYLAQRLAGLANEFGHVLEDARGKRHLAGVKFRRVEDALDFHRRAVEAGLWIRVHAYHPGHRTILLKLGLAAEEEIVDFVVDKLRALLDTRGGRAAGSTRTKGDD
jgi:acetylornithine/succinyldiaminopimelate/putrescine aminotransferase